MEAIEESKQLFENIMCLCSEGPEFMNKIEICEAIIKEATKGFELCKSQLSAELHVAPDCEHEWVSVVNEVVQSGEICLKCNAVRSG